MELFLIYVWLKLSTIVAFCIIGAILSAAVLFFAHMFSKVVEYPELSLEDWLATSKEGKDRKSLWPQNENGAWERGYRLYCPKIKKRELAFPLPKYFYCVPLVFLFFGMFIPDKTETAILVASSVAIDVAKSPEGTKIGQLLRGKANELLDAELKKLTPQPAK